MPKLNISFLLLLPILFQLSFSSDLVTPDLLHSIEKQVMQKYRLLDGRYPEYTENGVWKFREKVNWLSGFLGGELWLTGQMTGNPELQNMATEVTHQLFPFAGIDYTHDMGFIFLPTAVQAWRMTGDERCRSAALQAAGQLASRFNRAGQFIQAWGKVGDRKRGGWMIIDTMMNIELLFWAAAESGEHRYYDIAYRHALTTLKEALRENGSSYHVVEFDAQSGEVLKRRTHQGAADESTWARGQAWGIYGFANAYRRTGDARFLQAARRMADYFLRRLPPDRVPAWDLDLAGTDAPKDASAAAVAACGIYLLSEQVDDPQTAEDYQNAAREITASLVNNYLFSKSGRDTEQGLLLHTIYHYHKKWGVDESFPAGDYFFLEALYRTWQREQRLFADEPRRQRISLNRDWFYLEDNPEEVRQLSKSAVAWQRVDLPHTWNRWDAVDDEPGYRRDAGWYQKKIFIPEFKSELRLLLDFEGANIVSEVYVNGRRAGGHVGGYVGFEVDITPFIRPGAENILQIRVDNCYDPNIIPSQKSDFFIYGGITRDLWLKVVPAVHITAAQISTPLVTREKAEVRVRVNTAVPSGGKKKLGLQLQLLDPDGRLVGSKRSEHDLEEGEGELAINFGEVANPRLWSPDHPHLYEMRIRLSAGEAVDEVSEKIGFRWFEFKENGPFYLNGERLLLRGTHRHEEHAGYGAAMPDRLHRSDMEQIRELGANFVRLAHYPQDPEIYRACDELGLLVWDELPWCRGGMGGAEWKANTRRLLREQIRQNFNHPSIILWSLGNELYWLPDCEGGGNVDSLRVFLAELNDLAHRLDPGRKTALRKFYEGADIVDVFSPSIWAGWYSGVYTNYEKALADARRKYPRFFHAEYGGSSHVGRHVENPVSGEGLIPADGWEEEANQVRVKNISKYGDWSESYIVDLFDWHLHTAEKLDWFSGAAQWAFKDFGTPLRPENDIPYLNQKGLLDRAGKPKDAYYVFKSYWNETDKFCYIESHTWTEREGRPGEKREVAVYSNAAEVELFLNGASLGVKKRDTGQFPAHGLHWPVNFRAGENRMEAVGREEGKEVCRDSLRLRYYFEKSGKPEKIVLSSSKLPDGDYLIEARVVDKNGRRCLDYARRIYFSCDGGGKLRRNYGTPTGSAVIEMANGYAAIRFRPLPQSRAVIEARNQDFKGSYLVIEN